MTEISSRQMRFIETIYNSLTGQKNGKFIKHN